MMSKGFEMRGCGYSGCSGITGEYLEEVGSGATVVLTGGHLTISMPAAEDSDYGYFEAEKLLMHLTTEAIGLLTERRDRDRTDYDSKYHDECRRKLEEGLPAMSVASVRDIRSLIVADALPVGPVGLHKRSLLEAIDHRLRQTSVESP